MQELMMRLGQSKAEKMANNFLTIEKGQMMDIIRRCGGDAFALWCYIEGKCYGKTKVFSFPALDTIAKEFKKDKKTIKRWFKVLEAEGAMKVVPCFEPSGKQMSNVFIVNAEFPEVPAGWDELYPEGVVMVNDQPHDRMEFLGTPFGQKVGGTNLSPSPDLSPSQNCPPKKDNSFMSVKKKNNECMRAGNDVPALPSDIVDIVIKESKKINLESGNLATTHGDEMCLMLAKSFKNRLDPVVVKMAFDLFVAKYMKMVNKKPGAKLENPTGWLYSCYKDALALYKAKAQ